MGIIDETDIHRQLADHHTRISVLETNIVHADDQREVMQKTLNSVQQGIHKIHSDLQSHTLEEARDRNKLLFFVVTTLLSVLGSVVWFWVKGHA